MSGDRRPTKSRLQSTCSPTTWTQSSASSRLTDSNSRSNWKQSTSNLCSQAMCRINCSHSYWWTSRVRKPFPFVHCPMRAIVSSSSTCRVNRFLKQSKCFSKQAPQVWAKQIQFWNHKRCFKTNRPWAIPQSWVERTYHNMFRLWTLVSSCQSQISRQIVLLLTPRKTCSCWGDNQQIIFHRNMWTRD